MNNKPQIQGLTLQNDLEAPYSSRRMQRVLQLNQLYGVPSQDL